MQFEELIKRIASELQRTNLPYMVLGGQAVLRYGNPRLTQDIDITLGISSAESALLLDVLGKLRLKPLVENPVAFLSETFVLPVVDESTGIRVDFIFSLSEYEREAIQRSNKFDIDGVPVSFITVEDLVIHKLVASRPRDIEDIRSVLRKNRNIDEEYILKWSRQYDRELGTTLESDFHKLISDVRSGCKPD